MPELELDKSTTALVVIDLQKGIAGRPMQPYTAQDVVKNAAQARAGVPEEPHAGLPRACRSFTGDDAEG